ncbi:radical SAM protein [Pyrobaculum neutrophilum]|uniref:Radical SAM domain protein n=1 Tax=Pyrobaculum neutrophilum (strain DSM 2338 / JCM 9278 / NBRC 100436 / V24Sta) TaxID=444157 RepID=B1YBQ8_PYRNV|nr:radical SAM/SPASM domain-containing protein [Pyrobaculum neutrophilum]ACB39292.1 Radical SAM domain protein [Pyrobaculum neutrophilum V24Sta]
MYKPRIYQVEVSTACNANCVYCPVSYFRQRGLWPVKLMDFDLYKRFLAEVEEAEYIHLQGWGEPLLHPRLIEMAASAKKIANVGITTNGTLLREEVARTLVEIPIDLVAVTFAGARAETHNRYRVGNDFNVVFKNVEYLLRIRHEKPEAVAVYMLLGDNYRELPEFVKMAARLGVDRVKVSNLNYLFNVDVASLKAFSDRWEKPREIERALAQAQQIAREVGVGFVTDNIAPFELAECPETPTKAVFITADGDICPCVYLGLPLPEIPRLFNMRFYMIPKTCWGNLKMISLKKIINSKKAKEFRSMFEYRRYNMDVGTIGEPPDVCKTCYRLFGI